MNNGGYKVLGTPKHNVCRSFCTLGDAFHRSLGIENKGCISDPDPAINFREVV